MKKMPDLGTLIILTLAFWLIFTMIGLFLERVGYPFHGLVFALVASITYLYLPRGEDE